MAAYHRVLLTGLRSVFVARVHILFSRLFCIAPWPTAGNDQRRRICFLESLRWSRMARPVCASVGVAVCPRHGDDSALLMRRADAAMYQAKASNSGYRVFNDLTVRTA